MIFNHFLVLCVDLKLIPSFSLSYFRQFIVKCKRILTIASYLRKIIFFSLKKFSKKKATRAIEKLIKGIRILLILTKSRYCIIKYIKAQADLFMIFWTIKI